LTLLEPENENTLKIAGLGEFWLKFGKNEKEGIPIIG
jgi:hypothetical protein